jgi:hypothetical protein
MHSSWPEAQGHGHLSWCLWLPQVLKAEWQPWSPVMWVVGLGVHSSLLLPTARWTLLAG